MSTREIKDSRIIVTGASSGIGRAVSLQLAREGAKLLVVARRLDRLSQLAEEAAAVNGRIEILAGDITDEQTRRRAIEAVQSHYGGLDILINNAGIGALGRFEDNDQERLRAVFEVNFFAMAEMTRLALPLLKNGTKPMLVNVSSILGRRGVPCMSEYSASKFAVQGFSEAVRAEFTRHGIDVLVVNPGTTETEFFDGKYERGVEPSWPRHKPTTAKRVAQAVVKAIRLGRHEIIPYHKGRILCWLNRISPSLMDRIMARYS
ncbi:MAG: SDR family NAD(P)-dependent oxidoreductase [Thermoguttaceae bacterium]|jgi:short-subunit dehydrogenase